MSKYAEAVRNDLRTDYTWNRIFSLGRRGLRAAPEQALLYATEKVPIVGWLPRYNPRWLLSDFIAGLTLGIMLIPQSLAYAKLANIPTQYGLMSSWVPATLYAFMGTSKDLSTGPTSIIGLLTSDIVKSLSEEDYEPSAIASAVAMMMGIYGMALGFLKLGFLLEFISAPILSGFISGIAVTIILGQVGSLLGEPGATGSDAATIIHDIFAQLPEANGNAVAVGFCGIILLKGLEVIGNRYGKKNKALFYICTSKQFIALLLFTGVSYAVNHKLKSKDYVFAVAKVKASGIETPTVPSGALLGKVAGRSIAPFIAAAVEHTSIARAFGLRNNYVTDQSQELTYLGLVNFVNSFFHSMGVGGAMSRTAVNSSCNVRSPLSGLVTTAVVLICIYELTGALYWVPKATLAAIVICAVWPLISSPKVFYRYWKTSLFDFIASMIGFWVSLFVSTEIGIACAVGFCIVYYMLRAAFARLTSTGSETTTPSTATISEPKHPPTTTPTISLPIPLPTTIPPTTRIFYLHSSIFFPNAQRLTTLLLDTIQTHHSPSYSTLNGTERVRNWSVVGDRRVARLRRKAGVVPDNLPALKLVVLDFSRCDFFDVTAMVKLRDWWGEVQRYAGKGVECVFVGCDEGVRGRLRRGGWETVDIGLEGTVVDGEGVKRGVTKCFGSVGEALLWMEREGGEGSGSEDVLEVGVKGDEKV